MSLPNAIGQIRHLSMTSSMPLSSMSLAANAIAPSMPLVVLCHLSMSLVNVIRQCKKKKSHLSMSLLSKTSDAADATTPKMEMSAFSDESPAAAPEAMKASVSTPNRNTLEFQRMHPGGVELRSLHNFKVNYK